MKSKQIKKSTSIKSERTEKGEKKNLVHMSKSLKINHKKKDSENMTNSQSFSNKIMNNTLSPIINFKKNISSELEKEKLNKEEALNLEILNKDYPQYYNGENSQKSFNTIKSYAFNSYKGLIKNDNEDKISICVNIKKPNNSKIRNWPKMSYFAIFDGHGGDKCAIFLKENYLKYLIEDINFPIDIKKSFISSIEKIENDFNKQFLNINKDNLNNYNDKTDFSGSCALICLIIENNMYICNIGDSRALMSIENGNKFRPLTIDHKPNNPKEYERIIKSGCKVYIDNEDRNNFKFINNEKEFDKYIHEEDIIYRISPCDLSVSRTIGDPKAKLKNLGGINNQIICTPEIFNFEINNTCDFIILGCDGIFDNLKNNEIIDSAWFVIHNHCKNKKNDIHLITLDICNMIIKNAMDKLSGDNLSVIVIGLEGLEKFINNKVLKEKVGNMFKDGKK